MTEATELKQFLDDYQNYVNQILAPTMGEITHIFADWRSGYYWGDLSKANRLAPVSPIHSVKTRIKSAESVIDKILKTPQQFPDGLSTKSFSKVHDAVGGRITVYFLAHIPLVDRAIRDSELLEISEQISPVAYLSEDVITHFGESTNLRRDQQDTGHASVHYVVRLRNSVLPMSQRPWFELQVRTLTEQLWRDTAHLLGYGYDKSASLTKRKQLQIINAQLASIDEHFNLLFQELSHHQETANPQNDDLLNPENLPAVLDKLGISCDQREIDGLLKVLSSRGVHSVGTLRDLASYRRMDLIRHTFWNEEGRPPRNFEMIASLAALTGRADEGEQVELIKAQLKFMTRWEYLNSALDRRY